MGGVFCTAAGQGRRRSLQATVNCMGQSDCDAFGSSGGNPDVWCDQVLLKCMCDGIECVASTNVDDCASGPCDNGSTCADAVDAYACTCTSGYDGTNCAGNVDECTSGPCENGSTCADAIDAYACACASGYGGANCADPVPVPPELDGMFRRLMNSPGCAEPALAYSAQKHTATTELVEALFSGCCSSAMFAEEDKGDDMNCAVFPGATPEGTCTDETGFNCQPPGNPPVDGLNCHTCDENGCRPNPSFTGCCDCNGGVREHPECDDAQQAEILIGCLSDSSCSAGSANCYFEDGQRMCTFAQMMEERGDHDPFCRQICTDETGFNCQPPGNPPADWLECHICDDNGCGPNPDYTGCCICNGGEKSFPDDCAEPAHDCSAFPVDEPTSTADGSNLYVPECIDCPPGKYVGVAGSTSVSDCIACATGKYVGVPGAESCAAWSHASANHCDGQWAAGNKTTDSSCTLLAFSPSDLSVRIGGGSARTVGRHDNFTLVSWTSFTGADTAKATHQWLCANGSQQAAISKTFMRSVQNLPSGAPNSLSIDAHDLQPNTSYACVIRVSVGSATAVATTMVQIAIGSPPEVGYPVAFVH